MTPTTLPGQQPATPLDATTSALELLRDEHVRRGFSELDVVERLDPGAARTLLKDRIEAETGRAEQLLVLPHPPGVPEFKYRIMIGETNRARVRRVLDFVNSGDRVLEIGVGFGYIAGILIREAAIGAYVGIDVVDRNISTAREIVRTYGNGSLPAHLEVKDLYDLSPDWLGRHEPDLVLLLEVLEHLPDAEKALATIAGCIKDDTAILLSVPTCGRLETVWGHVSIFDSARVRHLCGQAGLVAQHIEVVQDRWVFVLATKSRSVPGRLFDLINRSLSPGSPTAPIIRDFVPVAAADVTLSTRSARKTAIEHLGDDGVRVTSSASPRLARGKVAGVQFPVAGDERLRLEFSFNTPTNVKRVQVYLRGPRGTSTAQWIWTCGSKARTGKMTFALRPGKKYGPFNPFGVATTGRAEAAEIIVEARSPRKELSFTLHRLAFASARAVGG